VDFVNSILGPKLLSFLDMEELANLTDDNIEILKSLADYLTKESALMTMRGNICAPSKALWC